MGRRTGFQLKFKKDRRRSPLATALAWAAVAPFFAVTLLTFLSSRLWLADMAANFAWPVAMLALVSFVIAIVCRRPVPAVLALLVVLTLTVRVVSVPRAERGVETDALVLVFNAYAESPVNDKTLEMLRATEADVVLLNECSYDLGLAIAADPELAERYPHRELPEHGNQWSRGILSVWPMERLEQRDDRWRELRFVYLYRRAQIVRHPTSPFVASVTLFDSPKSAGQWAGGNETMRTDSLIINQYLTPPDLPIVMGVDYNATPAGWRTGAFFRATGLARAKPFPALSGTWPSWLPSVMRAPIDDLAVEADRGVRITSWRTVELETNSDHVPVLVGIDLPPGNPDATSQAP